jgi:hypothetical protein
MKENKRINYIQINIFLIKAKLFDHYVLNCIYNLKNKSKIAKYKMIEIN